MNFAESAYFALMCHSFGCCPMVHMVLISTNFRSLNEMRDQGSASPLVAETEDQAQVDILQRVLDLRVRANGVLQHERSV